MIGGTFGLSAITLEQQVRGLTTIVAGLLELVEPGLVIETIDPYSGWVTVRIVPKNAPPYAGIHCSGPDLAQAVRTATGIRDNVRIVTTDTPGTPCDHAGTPPMVSYGDGSPGHRETQGTPGED
jgi:hypothetical protein